MKRIIFVFMVLLVAVTPWVSSLALADSPYPIGWIREFGTDTDDHSWGIAVDPSGNILIAGDTYGEFPGQRSSGLVDAFIRKYSKVGVEQWTRQFGSPQYDYATDVAADGSGNSYVVGATYGTLPSQSSSGEWDVFIRKHNSAGVEQWTRQFGTASHDDTASVAIDASGNAYVAGRTLGAFPGFTNLGSGDVFIRKYNSAGVEQWTRQFGTKLNDFAIGIAADSSGNTYVVGGTFGALPGQSSWGGQDAFVRKYNSDGVEQWTRQFGTTSEDLARGVATDSSGNALVVGDIGGALPGQSSWGGEDAFVRKYNSDGVEQWTRQFGTTGGDMAKGVATDSSANIYVVGYTSGDFPGFTNLGSDDVFIRKYNSAGVELWTYQFGTELDDIIDDIAVDGSGNIYIEGWTEGTFPGQMNLGGTDVFLVKFIQGSPYIIHPVEYRLSSVHTPKYKWEPGNIYKSWQQVRLLNNGPVDAFNVAATITWAPANVTVLDGQVSFGTIPAGSSAWSTDDFSLMVDMNNPQPPNQGIVWKVEYYETRIIIENVPQGP